MIARVVHEVRQGSPTGAGFVKKEFYSDRWAKLLDEKAKDKVGHAIRKAAEELAQGKFTQQAQDKPALESSPTANPDN